MHHRRDPGWNDSRWSSPVLLACDNRSTRTVCKRNKILNVLMCDRMWKRENIEEFNELYILHSFHIHAHAWDHSGMYYLSLIFRFSLFYHYGLTTRLKKTPTP